MAPVIVPPEAVRRFDAADTLWHWYEAEHRSAAELWLEIGKKSAPWPTVTYEEALDIALCFGWIDAIKKSWSAESWVQRFLPRRPKSIWSQKNCTHVARLIAEGRMQPAGHAEIAAARADGRWDKAYAGSASMEFPSDLLAAIEAEPRALETFLTLNANNRFALAFRTHNLKTEAGRKKRIASFVAMLAEGRTIYPNGTRRPGKGAEGEDIG